MKPTFVLFAIIVINFVAVHGMKCGALRFKLGKQKECAPKPGHEKELRACYDPCKKVLIEPKNCTDYNFCCIHNCKCVMKGAGYIKISSEHELDLPEPILKSSSATSKKIPRIKGCRSSKKEDAKLKPETEKPKTKSTPKAPPKKAPTGRLPQKPKLPPKPTSTKKTGPKRGRGPGRPSRPSGPNNQNGRRPGPRRPNNRRPTRKTTTTMKTNKPTKEPCTKKPSLFANELASKLSFFLSDFGFGEIEADPCS